MAPGSAFDFAAFGAAANGGFGQVGFDFSVTASAEGFDDVTLYSVSASIQLAYDGSFIPPFENLDDAIAKLQGFQLDTPLAGGDIPYHSLGYSWLETGFDPTVGLLNSTFQTITYRTSVFSSANAPCLSANGVNACLLAYAGFGDPIGRGGGTSLLTAFSALGSGGTFGTFNHDLDTGITGLNFSPYTTTAPRIAGGTLFVGGGAVPEPATWLSMILGFGLLGTAMRRRRVLLART